MFWPQCAQCLGGFLRISANSSASRSGLHRSILWLRPQMGKRIRVDAARFASQNREKLPSVTIVMRD
jgi:hypothetical protein